MAKASGKKLQSQNHQQRLPRWQDLFGHEDTLAHWARLVQDGRLPQVLLIEGREGIGKSALAAALAGMFYCRQKVACGQCGACLLLQTGEHPEVLWLEVETGSRFLLEHAASLQEHLAFNPSEAGMARTVVLVDADKLSLPAANRLLKILEEPPVAARIILTTSRFTALLETIRSRCVRWRVAPPSVAQTSILIKDKLKSSGIEATEERVERILRLSGLAPGKALRLCQQLADHNDEPLLNGLLRADNPAAVLAAAENLVMKQGLGAAELLQEWETALNSYYRQALTQDSEPQYREGLEPMVISRRRDILRQTKRLAIRQRVPLNGQLISESLALFPSERGILLPPLA